MGRIHLNRDRKNLGQFTPDEVAEGLATGRFLATDLAWREGMETWQPLSTFTDLPARPVEPLPDFPLEPVVDAVPAPDAAGPFPWERAAEIGIFSALWETLSLTLGSPRKLFARLSPTPSMRAAYLFYLPLAVVAFSIYSAEMLVFLKYFLASIATNPELAADPDVARTMNALQKVGLPGMALWFGFLVFVVGPCIPFVFGGVYHMLLMLFGGAKESFAVTFAATCYVFGATSPLIIIPIPCCGHLVMFVWGMVSLSIALAVVHRTDAPRAAAAVVIPFVLCCGGYFGLNLLSTMSGMVGSGLGQ